MKPNFIGAFLLLVFFFACSTPQENQVQKETYQHQNRRVKIDKKEEPKAKTPETSSIPKTPEEPKPVEIYPSIFPNFKQKTAFLDTILSIPSLSENNKHFIYQLKTPKDTLLKIEQTLFPIFRMFPSDPAIYFTPKYKMESRKYVSITPEEKWVKSLDKPFVEVNQGTKILKHPHFLDSIYQTGEKPSIFLYSSSGKIMSMVRELSQTVDECDEAYRYSIDTSAFAIHDSILIGSPYPIDLVYEKNSKVDSLFLAEENCEYCDCPSSNHLHRCFARLEGTENVWFVYADTFPLNNKLDTPSRAMIYIKSNGEYVYLWLESMDLFGCACL